MRYTQTPQKTYLAAMSRTALVGWIAAAAFGMVVGTGCKKDRDEAAGTGTSATPATTGNEPGTGNAPGNTAGTGGTAMHPEPVGGPGDLPANAEGATEAEKARAAAAADPAANPGDPASDPEVVGTCTRIIERMVACADDRGFKKYQGRWTVKGAPAADKRNFGNRILAWRSGGTKADCEKWAKREKAAEHLGAKSKLAESVKDTKLSCTMFGQELDDDGWVPSVLRE